MPSPIVETPSDHEVIFSRVFDAPRELVWRVWSEARHFHAWWGPTGYSTTTEEFSFTPGGVWRHVMHGPDGSDNPTRVVFREIEPPSRLAFETSWDLPDAPVDFRSVATFVEQPGGTLLSLRMTFRDAEAFRIAVERYGVMAGGVQTLERLEHYVDGLLS